MYEGVDGAALETGAVEKMNHVLRRLELDAATFAVTGARCGNHGDYCIPSQRPTATKNVSIECLATVVNVVTSTVTLHSKNCSSSLVSWRDHAKVRREDAKATRILAWEVGYKVDTCLCVGAHPN